MLLQLKRKCFLCSAGQLASRLLIVSSKYLKMQICYFIQLPFKIKTVPRQSPVQSAPSHIGCNHGKNQISESPDFEIKISGGGDVAVPLKEPRHCHSESDAHHTVWHCSAQPNVHRGVCLSASCSVDPSPSDMHTHTTSHTLTTAPERNTQHTSRISLILPPVRTLTHSDTHTHTSWKRKRGVVLTDVCLLTFAAFLANQPICYTVMLYMSLTGNYLTDSVCFFSPIIPFLSSLLHTSPSLPLDSQHRVTQRVSCVDR